MQVSSKAASFADIVLQHHGCVHAASDAVADGHGHHDCDGHDSGVAKELADGEGEELGGEVGRGSGEQGKASGKLDYSKWEAIETKLTEEDTESPEKADPAKNQIWGCAQDHRKERDIYERPNSEKLVIAEDFKKQGDTAYKQKKLDEADYCYQKVLHIKQRQNCT